MTRISKTSLIKAARKAGFWGAGNFLVAVHSQDVVSGLALDVAPSKTYIWTFVLPTFDALSFMHMSLGDRVSACESDLSCLCVGIEKYRCLVSSVTTARQLIDYIDRSKFSGEYSKWVRYICLIRDKDFGEADRWRIRLLSEIKMPSIRERLEQIASIQVDQGGDAAYQMLVNWSLRAQKILPTRR